MSKKSLFRRLFKPALKVGALLFSILIISLFFSLYRSSTSSREMVVFILQSSQGHKLAGVKAKASGLSQREAGPSIEKVSDSRGQVEFALPLSEKYRFTFSKEGYRSTSLSLVLPLDSSSVKVTLYRSLSGVRNLHLSGVLCGPGWKKGEGGQVQLVHIQREIVKEAEVDREGKFHFRHLRAGLYTLQGGQSQRKALSKRLVLKPGEDRSGVELKIPLSGQIRGRVKGAGAEKFYLWVFNIHHQRGRSRQILPHGKGFFRAKGLDRGASLVTAYFPEKRAFFQAEYTVESQPRKTLDLEVDSPPARHLVSGTVDGVKKGELHLYRTPLYPLSKRELLWKKARFDEEGQFSFGKVEAGSYLIAWVKGEHFCEVAQLEVEKDREVKIAIPEMVKISVQGKRGALLVWRREGFFFAGGDCFFDKRKKTFLLPAGRYHLEYYSPEGQEKRTVELTKSQTLSFR